MSLLEDKYKINLLLLKKSSWELPSISMPDVISGIHATLF